MGRSMDLRAGREPARDRRANVAPAGDEPALRARLRRLAAPRQGSRRPFASRARAAARAALASRCGASSRRAPAGRTLRGGAGRDHRPRGRQSPLYRAAPSNRGRGRGAGTAGRVGAEFERNEARAGASRQPTSLEARQSAARGATARSGGSRHRAKLLLPSACARPPGVRTGAGSGDSGPGQASSASFAAIRSSNTVSRTVFSATPLFSP